MSDFQIPEPEDPRVDEPAAPAAAEQAQPEAAGQEAASEGQAGEEKPEGQPRAKLDEAELHRRLGERSAALKAERAQRRALERRLEALEAAKTAKGSEAPDEPPDPEADPVGAIAWATQQVQAYRQAQAEQQQREAQIAQHQQQLQSLEAQMGEFEADFALETPDYYDATAFLRESRTKELMGFGLNQQQATQQMLQELAGLVQNALQRGIDPAAQAYGVAKMRGFGQQSPQQAQPNPMDAIRKGQQAAKTMSNVGGQPADEINLEMLNSMELPPLGAKSIGNDKYLAGVERFRQIAARQERSLN